MSNDDFISGLDTGQPPPLQDFSNSAFDFDQITRDERIKRINIFQIYPDGNQPRRIIPSIVRQAWDNEPEHTADLFANWLQQIGQERDDSNFDPDVYLETYITETTNDYRTEHPGAIETALLHIMTLALSIRHDQLTNPITLTPSNDTYLIETGERRWLAHHFLYHAFPEEQDTWDKIPARIVDQRNVWRQASENNARADLNAIARARQFAILMMDLWQNNEKKRKRFKMMDTFETEQAYYAQVADLSPPYGKSELLLNAMGFKHRNAIMRSRQLLKLHNAIWVTGDDQSLSEDRLLQLAKMPTEDALNELQIENVTTRDNSEPDRKTRSSQPVLFREQRRTVGTMERLYKRARKGDPASHNDLLKMIEGQRRWLDKVEKSLQK